MTNLFDYLNTASLAPPLPEFEAQHLAQIVAELIKMQVYPRSITASHNSLFFLGQRDGDKFLGIVATDSAIVGKFEEQTETIAQNGTDLFLTVAPATAANAAILRGLLPFLVAQPLGMQKSAGCGDRLGLATPGHIRAVRNYPLAPIFAQQSIRENARTGRTPQQVMDEAMWGVFQEGWRNGFGADADHLKTTADIDLCVAAGYTFYTIDPGEHVDDSANHASPEQLWQKVETLPWIALDSSPEVLENGYIVSRNLDNKAGTAAVIELLRYLKDADLPQNTYVIFTVTETIGAGIGSAVLPEVSELVTVDFASIQSTLKSPFKRVTLASGDSSGPYDYHLTAHIRALAQRAEVPFQQRHLKAFHSDAAAALVAGHDVRTAVLAYAGDASHSLERTHIDSLLNLVRLLECYLTSAPTFASDEPVTTVEHFSHQIDSARLGLGDKAGRLRGYYDTREEKDMTRIVADVNRLLAEPLPEPEAPAEASAAAPQGDAGAPGSPPPEDEGAR